MDHLQLDLSPDERQLAARAAAKERKTLEAFVSDCVRAYVDKMPNADTLETFAKTDAGIELNHYAGTDDLFSKFGI